MRAGHEEKRRPPAAPLGRIFLLAGASESLSSHRFFRRHHFMKQKFLVVLALVALMGSAVAQSEKPLRIFLRCGPKTHGPGEHDGPGFLRDWKVLLTQRGAVVDGAIGFPTAAQLEQTDVMVLYTAEGGKIGPADRANLDRFLQRGGGLVFLHLDPSLGQEH